VHAARGAGQPALDDAELAIGGAAGRLVLGDEGGGGVAGGAGGDHRRVRLRHSRRQIRQLSLPLACIRLELLEADQVFEGRVH
jgi:hypothetical protein